MNHRYFRSDTTNPIIVSSAYGDVNGDGIPDHVFLTGTKTKDSPFIQEITLVIKDGSTGRFFRIPISENAGYNPRLFLGDFTGDGIADILISIDSGGSGAFMYHYIYSFNRNIPKLLFDFNVYNETYNYKVTYQNFYKVEVVSEKNNKNYLIDISNRDPEYLQEIYQSNGKLKAPISGFVNPLSGLYPVDFDGDQVFELLAYQKIAGRYNADSLGYVQNTLKWNGSSFTLWNQYVAIL